MTVIRVNKKQYAQCEYVIRKNNNDDLDLSSSDESDNESDNGSDNESDNEIDH